VLSSPCSTTIPFCCEFLLQKASISFWPENGIARINPQNGQVIGWIDLTGLSSRVEVHDDEAVLNGIPYDGAHDRLFVTGKLWPKLLEIRVKP